MILVVDASVALKWFFHTRGNEANADGALAILSGIDEGRIQLAQPPHFIAEVAAVLAREKPDDAQADLWDLLDVECWFVEDPAIYASAVDLSIRLQHHLFDTLRQPHVQIVEVEHLQRTIPFPVAVRPQPVQSDSQVDRHRQHRQVMPQQTAGAAGNGNRKNSGNTDNAVTLVLTGRIAWLSRKSIL